jgi:prepilin-type N-terminal cleavage/methylation domain-containing protein
MRRCSGSSRAAAGFTLIEVLVVIVIIAVVVGIAIPVLSSVRRSSRSAACLSQLRAFGAAFERVRADNQGRWPTATREADVRLDWLSPFDALSPYLGGAMPTREADGGVRTNAPYRCPADVTLAPVTGFSYAYALVDVMALAQVGGMPRTVESFVESTPEGPILLDTRAFHARDPKTTGGKGMNYLMPDGRAVEGPLATR